MHSQNFKFILFIYHQTAKRLREGHQIAYAADVSNEKRLSAKRRQIHFTGSTGSRERSNWIRSFQATAEHSQRRRKWRGVALRSRLGKRRLEKAVSLTVDSCVHNGRSVIMKMLRESNHELWGARTRGTHRPDMAVPSHAHLKVTSESTRQRN